uniref:Transcription factor Adf-1 n=1 Tax=Bactrocera latifrons TaxID=174628 RepID=A0A0K8VTB8_BACLA
MSICSGIFEDERLIELVENHEILYNKHCTGYKGAGEKTESWIKIGEELGLTAEECAKRWKSLRERYSRELKLVENNDNYVVEWPLFGAFSFLRQFVKQRQGRSILNEGKQVLMPCRGLSKCNTMKMK